MKSRAVENKPGCVAFATKILGNKWTPLIIKNLSNAECRFTELEQNLHINPRTLSSKLHELEKDQIISKQVLTTTPLVVKYALTKKGLDLIPILKRMADWGEKYS